jgi:hypothetical protein
MVVPRSNAAPPRGRSAAPADAAAVALSMVGPDRHHCLLLVVDLDVLDDRSLQAEQACPCPFLAHVVAAPFDSDP